MPAVSQCNVTPADTLTGIPLDMLEFLPTTRALVHIKFAIAAMNKYKVIKVYQLHTQQIRTNRDPVNINNFYCIEKHARGLPGVQQRHTTHFGAASGVRPRVSCSSICVTIKAVPSRIHNV